MLPDGTNHVFSAWLFLRLLGLVYAVAFVSLAVQIKGLVGARGVLPVEDFLRAQKSLWRGQRFFVCPTICWWKRSDTSLQILCWTGFALSIVLVVGPAPAPILIALWLLYLSLFTVGQLFLGYQWDVLLLETGFLAIFLAPLELSTQWPPSIAPSPIAVALLYWLLFRLMFFSGWIKLRSRDQAWRQLTALCHHYQTQPLPTPLAWWAWQLPASFHKVSTLAMFAIELVAPFLIFAGSDLRHLAAVSIVGLMCLIQLTGNYGFFNMITVALAVLLFSDDVWGNLAPRISPPIPNSWPPWILWSIAALVAVLSIPHLVRLFRVRPAMPKFLVRLEEWLSPFHLVNSYGLFSIMTTERPEIIVEGSDDGDRWQAYDFKFKIGDVARPPPWVAPHQPRLDWQMWFAALGDYRTNAWLMAFLRRLLTGSPEVLALLKHNPFREKPPVYIRAVVYDYRFTTRKTRRGTGHCWERQRQWLYCPILSLRGVAKDHDFQELPP